MAQQIFAYIVHKDGVPDDSAMELAAAAKKIDAGAALTAIVMGSGDNVDKVANAVASAYSEVWKVNKAEVAYPNAEIIRGMLVNMLPKGSIVLVPHVTFGMDLSPGLSVKLDTAYVADVVGIDGVSGSSLKIVRQEYSGQVSTHVECDISAGAVINVRGGCFKPEEANAGGKVVDKTADAGSVTAKRRFLEVVKGEVGEVDITKADVLVSVGRGIGEQDNLEIIRDLAKAMGAEVSCSRPIVDAKWLEKPRQVGTSGQTVKPKVYMALGISGSFQHLGGIKGSPFMVAINKNSKAPIFQVADVGVVADMLEFIPELTDKINDMK
ncbi:MAG: electron transfer flavoprotein subunit alpha/FixB family protein [Desulfobacterales bacterium]|nr:electron transfer flavoprotein subunit alpha/FixB family protein [Desulfobacterales bacterium]